MADRGTGGTGNADVAIKIILKNTKSASTSASYIKKINLSILAKLKNRKTKLKT